MPGLLQTPEAQFGEVKFALAILAEFLGTMFFTFAGTTTPTGLSAPLYIGAASYILTVSAYTLTLVHLAIRGDVYAAKRWDGRCGSGELVCSFVRRFAAVSTPISGQESTNFWTGIKGPLGQWHDLGRIGICDCEYQRRVSVS